MKKALALSLLLVTLLGCGGPMSDEAYGKAYKAECKKYLATAKKMDTTPLPKLTGLSKEQRWQALADWAKKDAETFDALAKDFRKLKPPTNYANLHKAYQEFLDGQVRIQNAYSAAIRTGNSAEATKQNNEFMRFVADQMNVVLTETEKLGGDVTQMRQVIADAAKDRS